MTEKTLMSKGKTAVGSVLLTVARNSGEFLLVSLRPERPPSRPPPTQGLRLLPLPHLPPLSSALRSLAGHSAVINQLFPARPWG